MSDGMGIVECGRSEDCDQSIQMFSCRMRNLKSYHIQHRYAGYCMLDSKSAEAVKSLDVTKVGKAQLLH